MAEFGLEILDFGREQCRKDKVANRLIHNMTTIHLIEKGKGYFNGIQLSEGQGFICRTDRISEWYPDRSDPWTYMWISVGGTVGESIAELLGKEDNIFSWEYGKNGEALKEICSSNFLQRTISVEFQCISLLYQILADATRDKDDGRREYVQRAKEAFKANVYRSFTVEQVAENLGISRAYLRNIFYQEMGCSPQTYMMRLRMERAEVLLREAYTVTEVAWAVGYADILQFSRIFKKYHGVSPTEYRKQDCISKKDE